MSLLVLDTETTILNKGNPFDYRNRLCYVGGFTGVDYTLVDVEYSKVDVREAVSMVRSLLDECTLMVLFNAKFDLHWLRRYGLGFSHVDVWDCQLVEFILTNQTMPYPSLDECCRRRGIGTKLDIVDTNYWSKGIDTPDIPREILEEYLQQDLHLTYQLYLDQKREIDEQTD